MNIRKIHALPAIALVAVLAACGTPATQSAAQTGSNHPAAAAENADSTASAPAKDDGTAKFGATYTYKDGLALTVSKPAAFKPSEYAAITQKQKNYRVFSVTVVNKTGKPYDANLFNATMQSGNEEMEQVFDMEKGVKGSPSTKVLNGRETKFKIAFGSANPKDMVLEVAPGFEYDSVIFTG